MAASRISPSISIEINGTALTPRQMEVILAVKEEKSQNKAASKLGITTPVLNRYISQIEKKTGISLVQTRATGTELTEEGQHIVEEYYTLKNKLEKNDFLNISGTPVSQELLMSALSAVDPEGRCNLMISDDKKNLSDLKAGIADMIVLDDPLYLFEAEEFEWETIGEDRLLHEDHGERYAYFRYGAQRIGFRYLELENIPYKIERTFSSMPALVDSGLSFFINESLALRRGVSVKSITSPEQLTHEITAVYSGNNPFIEKIIKELKRLRNM